MIFFRDGISEGQFQIALQSELPAIRSALAAAGGEAYARGVQIAFVVAQKRHNTRFFMADPSKAPQGGNGNVPSVRGAFLALRSAPCQAQQLQACGSALMPRSLCCCRPTRHPPTQGTVVDTTVCHPTDFDFYLTAHGVGFAPTPTHPR